LESATTEPTVNKIHYSMFYAVNAVLILKGIFAFKHSGVIANFNKEFVKKGLIEKECRIKRVKLKNQENNFSNSLILLLLIFLGLDNNKE
jgi:uncharacterized protein (UPF0332 family)